MKEEQCTLSIITITYNRLDRLKRLVEKMFKSHEESFTWWIINDGSDDGTEQYLKSLPHIYENLTIRVKNFENGGKHRAINKILPEITTDLMLLLDDDDYLTSNAIYTIKSDARRFLYGNENRGSLIYEHGIDESIPMKALKKDFDFGKRFWYLLNNNISGDFVDVFVTSKINKYKLPEFTGEKFISEGILYLSFSENYESVFIKKILTVGPYQSDGLTRNIRNLQVRNINGSLFETYMYLEQKNIPYKFIIKKKILLGKLLAYYSTIPDLDKQVVLKEPDLFTKIVYIAFKNLIKMGIINERKN